VTAFTLARALKRIGSWTWPPTEDGEMYTAAECARLAARYERLRLAEPYDILRELRIDVLEFETLSQILLPCRIRCSKRDLLPTFSGRLLRVQPTWRDIRNWYGERRGTGEERIGGVATDRDLLLHLAHVRIVAAPLGRRLDPQIVSQEEYVRQGGWVSCRGAIDVDAHRAKQARRAREAMRKLALAFGPACLVLRSSLGAWGAARGWHIHIKFEREMGVIEAAAALERAVTRVVGAGALLGSGRGGFVEVRPALERPGDYSAVKPLRLPLGYGSEVLLPPYGANDVVADTDPATLIRIFMDWWESAPAWSPEEVSRTSAVVPSPPVLEPPADAPEKDGESMAEPEEAGPGETTPRQGQGRRLTRYERETVIVRGLPGGERNRLMPAAAEYFADTCWDPSDPEVAERICAEAVKWVYLPIHGSKDIRDDPDGQAEEFERRVREAIAKRKDPEGRRGEIPASADFHDRLAAAIRMTINDKAVVEQAFSIAAHLAAWVRYHQEQGRVEIPIPTAVLKAWGASAADSSPLCYRRIRDVVLPLIGAARVAGQASKAADISGELGRAAKYRCVQRLDGVPELIASSRRKVFPAGGDR
jgi:hypothetical protein